MSQNDAPASDDAEGQDAQGVALSRYISLLRSVQGALLDPCVLVDKERRMVAFNRAFFMLFPRRQARQLEGRVFDEALLLRFKGDTLSPVDACFERSGAVRFDEIEGEVPEGRHFHFIVSATPMMESERPVGAWVMLRDVSDEVEMQGKYQDMLKVESQARSELEGQLRERTAELLASHDKLNELQGELMDYAKGLRLPGQGRLISLPKLRQRPLPRAALDAEAARGRSLAGAEPPGVRQDFLNETSHDELPSVDMSGLGDDIDEMMVVDFDPIMDPAAELGLDLELEEALRGDDDLVDDEAYPEDMIQISMAYADAPESFDADDESVLVTSTQELEAEDTTVSILPLEGSEDESVRLGDERSGEDHSDDCSEQG